MGWRLGKIAAHSLGGLSTLLLAGLLAAASARAEDPIRIGFSFSQTGPLAPNGKQALLGARIWEEDINAAGGLLGRKVELVVYDDQSNPSNVPGIYAKLLEVDKVDLVMGPYGTNLVAPALPIVIPKGKVVVGLFALDVNAEFKYPKYFSMVPYGPAPKEAGVVGFFAVAAAQNPKPETLAIIAEDAEFGRNVAEGARNVAKKFGFKIIFDKTFPPGTTDFSPIVRALAAANADAVMACTYPLSSVGLVQSANELGFKPRIFGGAMVGLQATVFKDRLKSKLNGIVNYETWVPSPQLLPRAQAFFDKYQERAKTAGVDPLGYYLGGWGYADLQVLGEAVAGAKSLNDDKIAEYLRSHEVKTIMGDIQFGPDGEWSKSRMLEVQYHDVRDDANLDTWRGMSYQTILYPPEFKTSEAIYPYEKAK